MHFKRLYFGVVDIFFFFSWGQREANNLVFSVDWWPQLLEFYFFQGSVTLPVFNFLGGCMMIIQPWFPLFSLKKIRRSGIGLFVRRRRRRSHFPRSIPAKSSVYMCKVTRQLFFPLPLSAFLFPFGFGYIATIRHNIPQTHFSISDTGQFPARDEMGRQKWLNSVT